MRAHLIGAALAVALCTSAMAQESPEGDPGGKSICGPLTLLTRMLDADFGEVPVAHQLTGDGYTLTAYVNEITGSWTIVAHDGTGGCVIQGGWEDTLPESLLPFVGQGT